MKYIIFMMLFITGCTATLHQYNLEKANLFCNEKGGIDYIKISSVTIVRCINGDTESID